MKKILYIFILTMIAATSFASKVTNVELSYQDGQAVARVDVSGAIRFTHQTEIPKDGKPDRVIVDILSATHELPGKVFENIPPCPVTAVRTSQYAVKPEAVVRIVFDMKTTPVYQVDTKGQSIFIRFTDKSVVPFPTWSTTSASTEPVKAPATSVKIASTESAPKSATPAQKNMSAEKDRVESLSGTASTTTKPGPSVASRPSPVAAPQTPTSAPTVAAVPKSEIKSPVTAPATTPVPTGLKSTMAAPSKQTVVSSATTPTVASPKPESTPITAPAIKTVSPLPTPAAQKPETSSPTTTSKPETSATSPAAAAQAKPNAPVTPTVSAPNAASPKPMSPEVATSVKPAVSAPASSPTAPRPADVKSPDKAATENPAASPAQPTATKEKTYSTKEELMPEPEDLELAQENPYVDHDSPAGANWSDDAPVDSTSTARFRRHPLSAAKIKGTMIAQFPQRLVIKYQANGMRDPFQTLIDETRTFNSPTNQGIPNVDGLHLVGVIIARKGGNRALLQDKNGYSYMLGSGDKVRNGYVVRIESDRVYFQIFEYGWSRTIALKIDES